MKIGIIGAGTMGQGIAAAFLESEEYEIFLCDVAHEKAELGKRLIERSLSKLVDKRKISEGDRQSRLMRVSTGVLEMTGDCDLVIEAVAENMEVKQKVMSALDQICKKDTILATNTSSLSVTEISSAAKRSVIGMHFFNPVPVMKLVEVIRAVDTTDDMVEKVKGIVWSIGKVAVEVEDYPGFIVNRILIPMINEAIGMYEQGVAAAEDIDTAMKLGANHPIGPLALGDLIGLDVCLAIMEVMQSETGDPKYRPEPLLKKMVRANRLGRKTGKGFFEYL